MNVGYAEAIKDYDFNCFVFHDVDLILENDKAIYACSEHPRHLSSAVDKFNYKLPYEAIFGKFCKTEYKTSWIHNSCMCIYCWQEYMVY